MPSQLVDLVEYAAADPARLKVDRAAGVIRGVKVLGWKSGNDRRYLKEGVNPALYEGRPVNANHVARAGQRSVHDREGWLEGIEITSSGVYGNLRFLDSESPLARKLYGAAEHRPDAFGLSHHARGRQVKRDGETIIESVESVLSVDVVTDPATTRSLMEAYMEPETPMDSEFADTSAAAEEPVEPMAPDDPLMAGFEAKMLEIFRNADLDAASKLSQIRELLKAQEKLMNMGTEMAEPAAEEGGEEEAEESLRRRKPSGGNRSLQEQVNRYRRQERALELCEAQGILPNKLLRMALAQAADEAEMKLLIKEYRATARPVTRPRSSSPMREVTEGRSDFARMTDDDLVAFLRN